MKAPMRPGESENILRDPERDDGRRKRRKRNATLNETDRLRADLKQATVVVRLYLETIDNKPRTKPGRVDIALVDDLARAFLARLAAGQKGGE